MLEHPIRRFIPVTSLVFFLLGSTAALAQVTTSGLRGSVRGPDGNALSASQVILIHEPSNNVKSAKTNDDGEFAFTGLRVGGPYTVSASSDAYNTETLTGIMLDAGKNQRVTINLREIDVITVTGQTAVSPSAKKVFGVQELLNLPTVGRDPKDIVRLSADAYTDPDNGALSIGGVNSRFNSVTIDGIRQDDDFGLNSNGYPTQRSPISLTAIQQIAVERTPFDVRYGNFLGGNVNVVTKSGTNDLHGSVLATFANQSLTGTKTEEDQLDIEFQEIVYGASVGGPIVKDKLHFFLSAEGLSGLTPSSVGPAGSGAVNEVSAVAQSDFDRAVQISRDIYGFDAGASSQALDEADLKILAKVDWAVNDRHRVSGKYQRTAGNTIRDSFSSDEILALTSNWYNRSDILHTFSLRAWSDWNERFSTELDFSGKIVDNRQEPLNGTNFMTAEIGTPDGGTIVLGPDPFRHANKLDNNLLHFKASGDYLAQNHLITGGWEYDKLQIFNLFVPFSNGVAEYASLDDFEAQNPDSIFYSNAISNNPDDGAANWGYGVHAMFLQDQWDVSHRLSASAGVRFELYTSADAIDENPNFLTRHGFTNTSTINGRSAFMPRAGLSFRLTPNLSLRGGAGLYAGGTPNVWMSNNYSNDGVSIDSAFSNDPNVIGGFDGRTVPQEMQDSLARGDGNVDALDPNFKIPSTWKIAAGLDYDARIADVKLNYVYSKVNYGMQWKDLRRDHNLLDDNVPVGVTPDGRPYYDVVNFDTRRGYDMLLTNTREGYGHTASVEMSKNFDFGLALLASYAWQDVHEVSPATSSRSVSNYGYAAVADPNSPDLALSNYARPHRVVGSAQFSRPLIADITRSKGRWRGANTTVSVFMEARSGQPYSYTFGSADGGTDLAALFGEEREFARRNRQLFYVPKGDGSDVILQGIDEAEFNAFLKSSGLDKYRGKIAPRNAFESSWINRVDLRFAQELPSPVRGNKARVMLDVQNVGNLLNNNWGRVQSVGFPYTVPVVDVSIDPGTGRYVYSNLRTNDPERVNVLASVWRVQLGVMYEF